MALDRTNAAPSRRRGAEKRLAAWTAGYACLPGVYDEFLGEDGKPRPHWLHFLHALAELDAAEISRRFASADRHIRDMGISYRVYGETGERSWPLSHLPLLIGEASGARSRPGSSSERASSKRFSAISTAKRASSRRRPSSRRRHRKREFPARRSRA